MASWSELLDRPGIGEHFVQLYGEDDQLLARNVSRYLAAGLKRGDGLVVIASSEHATAIRRHLSEECPDIPAAVRTGRLLFLDARATLDRFTVDGEPDRERSEEVIGRVLRDLRTRSTTGQVRAFGEMVALLWAAGRAEAAIRLEEYWNHLLRDGEFSLFCAYPLDILSEDAELDELKGVLHTHTHVCAGPGTTLSRSP
jgi:KaiC/GvpD/RAD55 family RecA-like ATPase